MSKTVMSVKEFAEDIGVSVPTAYVIANRADFPAIRVSDRRIIIPIGSLPQVAGRSSQRKAGPVRRERTV